MEWLSMRSTQLLVSFLWRLRSNVCRRFWVKIKPPHPYNRSTVQIIVPQKCYQIIFRKWRDFFSVKIIPRVKQILFNFYISSLQYVALAKKLAQSTWLNWSFKKNKRTKLSEIFVFYWPDLKWLDLTTFRPACWGHSEDHYCGYLTLPLTL